MIFLGSFIYPKIMKIVLPLSYHVMNIYKKFWGQLEQVDLFHNS